MRVCNENHRDSFRASASRSLLVVMCLWIGFAHAQAQPQWIETLPQDFRQSILWSADHETGNLKQWEPDAKYPGGGILNTGDDDVIARASKLAVHSGKFSAEATISKAIRSANGKRAVRLMRWTDKPWDQEGKHFPTSAFYSTWMFLPVKYNPNKYSPWDPGDGGWWNVFQFKANDENDVSQSVWTLDLSHDDDKNELQFGLFHHLGETRYYEQKKPRKVPVGRWLHVEAFLKVASDNTGQIIVWQDGVEVLRVENVQTAITKQNENSVWGVGNYTDHIAGGEMEGTATIFFDDAMVSTKRASSHLKTLPQRGKRLPPTGKRSI